MPYYSAEEMKKVLDEYPQYRDKLYCRGFLLTNGDAADLSEYPFYGNWSKQELIGGYKLYLHKDATAYTLLADGRTFFIIGHAYNPFTMSKMETYILREMSESYEDGIDSYQKYVDGITGVFGCGVIDGKTLRYQADAVAMRVSYWGIFDGNIYISSHCNLIQNLKKLERDTFVDELVNYKFYRFFGAGLPGDLSPYKELKRVQANFEYVFNGSKIEFHRIFPTHSTDAKSYESIIERISIILENNMELILKKWGKDAALSLTGGRDSTTSLAGAHKLLNNLQTFTYVSCEGEKYDADAASIIADRVGVKHEVINIELSEDEEAECECISKIIEYNMGCIGKLKEKEIRKRVYFLHHQHFNVEIKSWVDEIGRARLHKRYLKSSFSENLKPRYLTTAYKFFALNRGLVRKTDCVFEDYISTYYSSDTLRIIPWWDLLYWEYSWGASEALHLVNEYMLSAEVTIPFNNRVMLSEMLKVELDKRISDSIQIDTINKLLPVILQTGISVKDFGWNKKRELSERLYYEVNTRLPF